MTTIAYDGEMIAADTMSVGDFSGYWKKILVYENHIIGCCHEIQQAELFNKWLKNQDGDKPSPSDMEGFTAIFIEENGKCFKYQSLLVPFEVRVPQAIGSGCEFAMGAMIAGKTAKEAVEIAIELDPYSGGDVQVVILHEAEDEKRIKNCLKQYNRTRTTSFR